MHRYCQVKEPVAVCVVGSGGFGRSFMAQARRHRWVQARVAVDRSASIAAQSWRSVGVSIEQIALCHTAAQAQIAWDAGQYIAADDVGVVLGLPLQVLVEATGDPEAGARHARDALAAGWHVALASKEVDSVVGPELCRQAQAIGKVVTPVDGDQPALLVGLITWAQALGLNIVAAGKASEYDFVFDVAKETLHSNGVEIAVPGLAAHWTLPQTGSSAALAACIAARANLCASLPQHLVPDLCELQIVANHTGLSVDAVTLRAPIARPGEIADLFRPAADGGLFGASGVLDVFHCLRRPDELSFAGGVFVVVRCEDAPTWQLLCEKGHTVSRDRRHAMLYIPRHLLGLEAMTSVLEAAVYGVSSGVLQPAPRWDLVARATRALSAGSVLAMGGHHHSIADVAGELLPAAALADDAPVPFYLASNRRLRRDVAAGTLIRVADVDIDATSTLLALRRQQDAAFFPSLTNTGNILSSQPDQP